METGGGLFFSVFYSPDSVSIRTLVCQRRRQLLNGSASLFFHLYTFFPQVELNQQMPSITMKLQKKQYCLLCRHCLKTGCACARRAARENFSISAEDRSGPARSKMSAVTQQTLHYWFLMWLLDEARNPDVVRPQMFLAVPL